MWTLIKAGLGVATGGVGTAALSVGGWLLKHWKLALGLLVVLAIGITFKVLLVERDDARAQVAADAKTIDTLTKQKTALQANVDTLTAEIGRQSASIAAMRAAGDAAKKAASDAVKAALEKQRKDAATIAALQKRGADPSNKGSCDDEINRIRAGL